MQEHSKCATIAISEFRLLLGEQDSFDLFDEIKKQIQLESKWDEEWNETFKNCIQHFKELINHFIEQIITNFFFDPLNKPDMFSPYDCNLLLNSKTIEELEEVANQRKLIQDLDEEKLYLFAKLFKNKQQTEKLLSSFQPDLKTLKSKLESIQKELKSKLQQFEDSISQINLRYQQNQQNLSNLYSFIGSS